MDVSRVLFASWHAYIDPSSGAAISTRDLMELFVARGIDARVLTTGVLDYAHETPIQQVLDRQGLSYRRARAMPEGTFTVCPVCRESIEVYDLEAAGVRVTLMPTASSCDRRALNSADASAFISLYEQTLDQFRPQVLMTFGGHAIGRELISRASRRGIPVVFHVRNFQYTRADLFKNVAGAVVTTEYTKRHYARSLGLDCSVIPNPLRADKVVARDRMPRYLTFINPQHNKGMSVFARIAVELESRRPEIPLLVVEGRSLAENLANVGLDLSRLRNLYRMPNTPDPRDFYRVSRAVLVPSLWQESFGRVAAEAIANGLPVLASDRGALPETLGGAGFILPVPDRCTPTGGEIPTAAEVEPWINVIERLWDDPEWEEQQRARALTASCRWSESGIIDKYRTYFRSIVSGDEDPSGGGWPAMSFEEASGLDPDPLALHPRQIREDHNAHIESLRLLQNPVRRMFIGSVPSTAYHVVNPPRADGSHLDFDPAKTVQFDAGYGA